MSVPPNYFEPIRARASVRWDQLEADPELAGPWLQLFKQVQSPRHVLSELLQNADDAGATAAAVLVRDGYFVFKHNGEDFSEEHFASLCRFGYSNKRSLHTIGFRGIGFKSTFSLGDRVELYTPTLSVGFDRARFTEPKWIADLPGGDSSTVVRVHMKDNHRIREVQKNLEEWLKSPVSLLFFKTLRFLRVNGELVSWKSMGSGPAPGTEWMSLHGKESERLLIARSDPEEFPSEALQEIHDERLLGADQEISFPPCRIEIVLQKTGRLYVVLPTGVAPELPFSCNAPFIQDPARVKIKDPDISPTNRWLLGRAGKLAASTMLNWLGNTTLAIDDRANAYGLVTDLASDNESIEATCARIVDDSFTVATSDKELLLSDSGVLEAAGQCVIIADELHNVWPGKVAAILDPKKRTPLSPTVSQTDRQKLIRWGIVEELRKNTIFESLQQTRPPKPTWEGLLLLWSYIGYGSKTYPQIQVKPDLHIIPVHGQRQLCSGEETVRISDKRVVQSDADWQFLTSHLNLLNQNWVRFLTTQRQLAEESRDLQKLDELDTVTRLFSKLGVEQTSDVSKVIAQVAESVFSEETHDLSSSVWLAQIAAKLEASVGDTFRFTTRDLRSHTISDSLLYDVSGKLEAFLPAKWANAHLLHEAYTSSFQSCSADDWNRWIESGRSNLFTLLPVEEKNVNIWTRDDLQTVLNEREREVPGELPYRTTSFVIEDWDFDDQLWEHWVNLAGKDDRFWCRLAEELLRESDSYITDAGSAKVLQKSTSNATKQILNGIVLPAWILKLRRLPCLPDTRGICWKPSDLLRRTPETEPLLDVEPFVHGRLDNESTKPLLRLLGVRDVPTGPDRIVECIRALAQSKSPPLHELQKWYERLDQLLNNASSQEFKTIKQFFQEEKLIFAHDSTWVTATSVFLMADEEDAPGSAVIMPQVRDLSLWRKVGVADRPSAELAIQWLSQLPSGSVLPADDLRRVRALVLRHPTRIYYECRHWLNLAREWAPVESLSFALTMQSLVEWSHLHEAVKQRTADLQRLPAEVTSVEPFCNWSILAEQIEERVHRNTVGLAHDEQEPWLTTLGTGLQRIILDDPAATTRIRGLAVDLEETVWRKSSRLELIPYIDGAPAGTPRKCDVVWINKVLYFDDLPYARLARLVPDRLGRIFGRADITSALNYCFDRSVEDVEDYLEQNFELEPIEAVNNDEFTADLHENTDVALPGSRRANRSPAALIDFLSLELDPDSSADLPDNEPVSDEESETIPSDEASFVDLELDGESEDDESTRDTVSINGSSPKSPPPRRHAKPILIERFALSQGFKLEQSGRFIHADGTRLIRTFGDCFPWAKLTPTGETIRHYWPKEACLQQSALQLDFEIWELLTKHPDQYSMILSDTDSKPIELTGDRLNEMIAARELVLYPATYRLAAPQDSHD